MEGGRNPGGLGYALCVVRLVPGTGLRCSSSALFCSWLMLVDVGSSVVQSSATLGVGGCCCVTASWVP